MIMATVVTFGEKLAFIFFCNNNNNNNVYFLRVNTDTDNFGPCRTVEITMNDF